MPLGVNFEMSGAPGAFGDDFAAGSTACTGDVAAGPADRFDKFDVLNKIPSGKPAARQKMP